MFLNLFVLLNINLYFKYYHVVQVNSEKLKQVWLGHCLNPGSDKSRLVLFEMISPRFYNKNHTLMVL